MIRNLRNLICLGLVTLSSVSYSQFTNATELWRLSGQYAWESSIDQGRVAAYSRWFGEPSRKERNGGVLELVRFVNGKPVFYATTGLTACDTVSADEIWPGGSAGLSLNGAGILMGIWDEGEVQSDHPELVGRVTQMDGASLGGSHSTPVAGVIIASGVDPAAKGFSFAGSLNAFDFTNDYSEMANSAADGLRVSNHSYGYAGGWFFNYRNDNSWAWLGDVDISTTEDYKYGFYGAAANTLDTIAYNAPNYLICQAVGNERGNGPATQPVTHWIFTTSGWQQSNDTRPLDGGASGFDTLMEQACAKNVISVGAADLILGGYAGASGVRALSTSSFGPTDDGRIKPDLVACGGSVYSSALGGGYTMIGGTSMATPNVTGTAGLLLQHYRNTHGNSSPTAATLKALMIHGADEAGSFDGPDYKHGYGLLNARTSAAIISEDVLRTETISERTLTSGGIISIPVSCDGTSPLKATICWTDPAGTASTPSLNNPNSKLVNNLDVIVAFGEGFTRPWILNPNAPDAAATKGVNNRDTVEQVLVPTPQAGIYTIIISHQGGTLLPSGTQAVSVIITGQSSINLASISVDPSTVQSGTNSTGTVTLDAPAPSGGKVIELADNDAAVSLPDSVTIPAGAMSAQFPIQVGGTSLDTDVSITGALNGVIREAHLTVLRSVVSSVSITPDRVTGGTPSVGTVTMNGPAPYGGANVLLSSSNPGVASVPATVYLPINSTGSTFTITTVPTPVPTTVTITATRAGISKSKTIIVRAPILTSLTLSPKVIAGSQGSVGRLNFSGPVPAGGFTVTLSEESPFVTVPASVQVAAGSSFATFDISTVEVTSNQEVRILARRGSVLRSNFLSVYPTTLEALNMSPTNVVGGTTSTGSVTLSMPAPAGGANVLLTSADPNVVSMPAFVTVPAGEVTKSFTITTNPVVATTNVQLRATRNGILKTRVLTVRP